MTTVIEGQGSAPSVAAPPAPTGGPAAMNQPASLETLALSAWFGKRKVLYRGAQLFSQGSVDHTTPQAQATADSVKQTPANRSGNFVPRQNLSS